MQYARWDERAVTYDSEATAWISLGLATLIILVAYPVIWLSARSRMPALRLSANASRVLRVMSEQQKPLERRAAASRSSKKPQLDETAAASRSSTRSLMKDLSLLPAFDRRDARERSPAHAEH